MAYQKNISKAAKITEIRIRELSPETAKEIGQIALLFRESRASVIVERLIRDYRQDQASIKTLQQRNSELHRAINAYYEKEERMKQIIYNFQQEAARTAKHAQGMIKHFTRKPIKRKGGRK